VATKSSMTLSASMIHIIEKLRLSIFTDLPFIINQD